MFRLYIYIDQGGESLATAGDFWQIYIIFHHFSHLFFPVYGEFEWNIKTSLPSFGEIRDSLG